MQFLPNEQGEALVGATTVTSGDTILALGMTQDQLLASIRLMVMLAAGQKNGRRRMPPQRL